MVFNFPLPTPSPLPLHTLFSSPTHPSLPQSASTARQALRQTLKRHTKLNAAQQAQHLQPVLATIETYLPLIFALNRGVNGDDRRIEVVRGDVEAQVGWMPTISAQSSLSLQRLNQHGKNARVKGTGLEFEIAFVMTILGYILSNLARVRCLQTLYSVKTPTTEEKTRAISTGMKNLLRAASVHAYLMESSTSTSTTVPDIDSSTQSALSHLAMAEATLLAVLKDDAYLSACVQSRNPHDKDWMVKAPDIPKVRALLFARLCVRAAEYAEQAAAAASAASGVDQELLGYMRVIARVARAKACRFFGIDAEMDGRVGEGIAWLRAGRGSLGLKSELAGDLGEDGKGKGRLGLSHLKREWSQKREARKVEKDAGSSKGASEEREAELDWGDDAGRDEEARVLDMLEEKWMKMNDTVNTQAIPSSTSYLSNLPSGRDIHSPPAAYVPPKLDGEQLVHMRAVPERGQVVDEDSSDEEFEPVRSSYY